MTGNESIVDAKEPLLARDLRRSLTVNNYDYLSSEIDETFPVRRRNNVDDYPNTTTQSSKNARESDYFSSSELRTSIPTNHSERWSRYLRRRHRRGPTRRMATPPDKARYVPLPGSATTIGSTTRNVNSDTMQILESVWGPIADIDDNDNANNGGASGRDIEIEEVNEWLKEANIDQDQGMLPKTNRRRNQPKEKKYRVIPVVKDKRSGRRSGGRRSNPRAIIQEEGTDGIVMMNVGGEGFPPFRLPEERRQYMHA